MTREEAIKYAEAMKAKVQERIEFFRLGHTHAPEVYYSDLAFLSAAISALREQGERRWIPVEDRLPGKYQTVVGWCKDNPFSKYTEAIVCWNGKGWVFLYAQRYVTNVTHWMPLPEPPKEE